MLLHPILNQLICGDKQGQIYIFEIDHGELLHQQKLSTYPISDMQLACRGNLLILSFKIGFTAIFSIYENFKQLLVLEEQNQESSKYQYYAGSRVLAHQSDLSGSVFTEFLRNSNTSYSNIENSKQIQKLNLMKQNEQFQVVSVHNTSKLRLHQIYKNEFKFNNMIISNYNITGHVKDFSIHSSNSYLLVISNEDLLYIFKLQSGELRGKIKIPSSSLNISLDPSGLYIFIAFPNMLNIYETGTGNLADQLENLYQITSIQVSFDGKFLALANKQGQILIQQITGPIRDSILTVLEQMKKKKDFWNDFPIYFQNNNQDYQKQIEQDQVLDKSYQSMEVNSKLKNQESAEFQDKQIYPTLAQLYSQKFNPKKISQQQDQSYLSEQRPPINPVQDKVVQVTPNLSLSKHQNQSLNKITERFSRKESQKSLRPYQNEQIEQAKKEVLGSIKDKIFNQIPEENASEYFQPEEIYKSIGPLNNDTQKKPLIPQAQKQFSIQLFKEQIPAVGSLSQVPLQSKGNYQPNPNDIDDDQERQTQDQQLQYNQDYLNEQFQQLDTQKKYDESDLSQQYNDIEKFEKTVKSQYFTRNKKFY